MLHTIELKSSDFVLLEDITILVVITLQIDHKFSM